MDSITSSGAAASHVGTSPWYPIEQPRESKAKSHLSTQLARLIPMDWVK